jgi:hypothetical protein
MKRRFWKFALLLVLPLALGGYMAERNSWRPYNRSEGRAGLLPTSTEHSAEQSVERPETIALNGSFYKILFSDDGHYLALGRELGWMGRHSGVVLFDRYAHRIVKTIPGAVGIFVVGQNNLVVIENGDADSCTKVYSLRDGKLLARSPDDFLAYAALPDGKTILGQIWRGNDSVRGRRLLSWDFSVPSSCSTVKQIPEHAANHANRRGIVNLKLHTILPPIISRISIVGATRNMQGLDELQKPRRSIQCMADLQTLFITDYVEQNLSQKKYKLIAQLWNIPHRKSLLHRAAWRAYNEMWPGPFTSTRRGLFAHLEGQLKIWNYRTGQLQKAFPLVMSTRREPNNHPAVHSLALSPDGSLLAAGTANDEGIGLWDTKTGRLVRSLQGHKRGIQSLAFAPDGRTLASGSSDGTVKLWRIK